MAYFNNNTYFNNNNNNAIISMKIFDIFFIVQFNIICSLSQVSSVKKF